MFGFSAQNPKCHRQGLVTGKEYMLSVYTKLGNIVSLFHEK